MRVLAFAASNSSTSINKRLVTHAAAFLGGDASVRILDLNDYEMPLFSVDRERELGHPPAAHRFLAEIAAADALLISFAEHNGSFTAAWKNLYDWCSRVEVKVLQGRPVVLLSASPGKRGGAGVMEQALKLVPHYGGEVRGHLCVPLFGDNFDMEKGELSDPELRARLQDAVNSLLT